MIDPALARAWCEIVASDAIVRHIESQGRPYLDRYFLAGWKPWIGDSEPEPRAGPALFLHHFVSSDPSGSVHSHPWFFGCSLILVGGYLEERCDLAGVKTTREYRPGELNVLEAGTRHRIELLEADCWTLFLAGARAQPWAFYPMCR
jgi:hypothetical protein